MVCESLTLIVKDLLIKIYLFFQWLDAEDFNRKKEIRTHLYKLREARLRGFYGSDDVDATTTSRTKLTRDGGGEMPPVNLSTITKNKFPFKSHGDSIIDHTYQSYKTKEIRDSESPTHEIHCTGGDRDHIISNNNLINKQHVADTMSDKSGWNIQTSSETSPDGKLHRNELYATTEGECGFLILFFCGRLVYNMFYFMLFSFCGLFLWFLELHQLYV